MDNELYYKILKHPRKGWMTVACLQWFDEVDYDQSAFVRNAEGTVYQFDDEQEAIDKLNEWYTFDQIDPEYRRYENSEYLMLIR